MKKGIKLSVRKNINNIDSEKITTLQYTFKSQKLIVNNLYEFIVDLETANKISDMVKRKKGLFVIDLKNYIEQKSLHN